MTDNAVSQVTILYGSFTCPMVPSVRHMLERAQVDYEYRNISTDAEAKTQVQRINNGYASVPTLQFADGSTLTEPSVRELSVKLESLGYKVPPPTPLQRLQSVAHNPILLSFGFVSLLLGTIAGRDNLMAIGAVILGAAILVAVAGRWRRRSNEDQAPTGLV